MPNRLVFPRNGRDLDVIGSASSSGRCRSVHVDIVEKSNKIPAAQAANEVSTLGGNTRCLKPGSVTSPLAVVNSDNFSPLPGDSEVINHFE